jgi:hypothetical protein
MIIRVGDPNSSFTSVSFGSIFFLQTPVILTRRIYDISLYDVSDYKTANSHICTLNMDMALIEGSISTRIKPHSKFSEFVARERQRFAADHDRYIFFG